MTNRACSGKAVGAGCILAATVGLAALLFPASPAVAQMTFSQATRDRDLYAKNPGFYDKEPAIPGQPNAPEIYVAKRPAVSLSLDEILAVVVDREPVLPDLKAILAYLKDRQNWEAIRGHYTFIFYFSKPQSRAVLDFLNQESGHLVIIRLNNHLLSRRPVAGSFSGPEFVLYMGDRTPDELKVILAPIQSRVVWK